MRFRIEANTVYDERNRALATISFINRKRSIRRTCACTIGEYFAILNWLMDRDEQIAAE